MGISATKTDNRSLRSKVELRRWLLDRMGLTRVRVLDVCSGAGYIWSEMEKYVDIATWVKVDIKPRAPGTLRMTSMQAVTSFPLEEFDVIDIDPYGEPWDAYRQVLLRLRRPTAVFLTYGRVIAMPSTYATAIAHGIPKAWVTARPGNPHLTYMPHMPEVGLYLAERTLRATWRYADILHAARVDFRRVTYYALGLTPQPTAPSTP
jgi:hypothetical protein